MPRRRPSRWHFGGPSADDWIDTWTGRRGRVIQRSDSAFVFLARDGGASVIDTPGRFRLDPAVVTPHRRCTSAKLPLPLRRTP